MCNIDITNKMANKVVIIGKGEFGNSLAQGMETAIIAKADMSVTIEQVSATTFFAMDTDTAWPRYLQTLHTSCIAGKTS